MGANLLAYGKKVVGLEGEPIDEFTLLAEFVSTSSTTTKTIQIDTTPYDEFYIEYKIANAVIAPFYIPYKTLSRGTRYRTPFSSEYADTTISDSGITIAINNVNYQGSAIKVYGR